MSDPVVQGANLPELPYDSWKDTLFTLHMWTQIVGKIRLSLTPLVNHWWNVPLYVNARGLTTSSMPYGSRTLEIFFDFIGQKLIIETSDGEIRELELKPQSVADFYQLLMKTLSQLGMPVGIWTRPCELPEDQTIPFEKDTVHKSYDAEATRKFWQILVWADSVLKEFRASFIGKSSPVHFFWGSFDLAGDAFLRTPRAAASRRRSRYPGSLLARSQQRGFLAGRRRHQRTRVLFLRCARARRIWRAQGESPGRLLSPGDERVLAVVRRCAHCQVANAALLAFLQSTYEAAADLGNWDRSSLER